MAEHRFSSEKGCVFVGCCDWGELWLQTLLVCFNLRNEEMVPIRKHSRMQVAGVGLTPTVVGCACELHGPENRASPEMVASSSTPAKRENIALEQCYVSRGALSVSGYSCGRQGYTKYVHLTMLWGAEAWEGRPEAIG